MLAHELMRPGSVHRIRMETVEVHRMRAGARIGEIDPNPIAGRRTNGWTGHLTIVSPGREKNARCDFNLSVLRIKPVLPKQLTARKCGLLVEICALIGGQGLPI